MDNDNDPKYKQLIEVSNPKKVAQNAREYFNDDKIKVYISNNKNKKYFIYHPETKKKVNFGDIHYADFTLHNDTERQANYLKRANAIRSNWRIDKYSANNLAIHLLWR